MSLIPALRGRGRLISKFEASLVYRVSSRTDMAIQRNRVWGVGGETNNNNNKKKKDLHHSPTMPAKFLNLELLTLFVVGAVFGPFRC